MCGGERWGGGWEEGLVGCQVERSAIIGQRIPITPRGGTEHLTYHFSNITRHLVSHWRYKEQDMPAIYTLVEYSKRPHWYMWLLCEM